VKTLATVFNEIEGVANCNTTVQEAAELAVSLLRIVERRAGTFGDPDCQWYPVIAALCEVADLDVDKVISHWHEHTI
jgi:hypothetical protein